MSRPLRNLLESVTPPTPFPCARARNSLPLRVKLYSRHGRPWGGHPGTVRTARGHGAALKVAGGPARSAASHAPAGIKVDWIGAPRAPMTDVNVRVDNKESRALGPAFLHS